MPDDNLKLEGVFSDETVAKIAADIARFGPGSYLRLYKKGEDRFVQVCDASGAGGDLHNDYHTCPGSPGC